LDGRRIGADAGHLVPRLDLAQFRLRKPALIDGQAATLEAGLQRAVEILMRRAARASARKQETSSLPVAARL